MSTEKIRKAVFERLEEIYKADSEYQYNLSKVVIPFSEFFKKSDSVDDEKESASEGKRNIRSF